jgi:hypothetical protein
MGQGSPARDCILTGLYDNRKEVCEAYSNVPDVIDQYVVTISSDVSKIQKTGKKMMEMTDMPYAPCYS